MSHTALWDHARLAPVAIRSVLVADPEGKRRMEACFGTDLEATPYEQRRDQLLARAAHACEVTQQHRTEARLARANTL